MAFDPDYRPRKLKIIFAYETLVSLLDPLAWMRLEDSLGIKVDIDGWEEHVFLSANTQNPDRHIDTLTEDYVLIAHGRYGDIGAYNACRKIAERTPSRIIIVYDPILSFQDRREIEELFGIKMDDLPFTPKMQISFFPWDKNFFDKSQNGLTNGLGKFGKYFRELAGVK